MLHIYSDESGSYGSEKYYTRSFCFIEQKDHDEVIEKLRSINTEFDSKELKSKMLSGGKSDILQSALLDLKFSFILCFTDMQTFDISKYCAYTELEKLVETYFWKNVSDQEKEKMLKRLKIYFFQKNYEPLYFRNLKTLLESHYKKEYKEVICDTFSDTKTLTNELKKNIRLELKQRDSKNELGIQLADMVAGIFRDYLYGKKGVKDFCIELLNKKGFASEYRNQTEYTNWPAFNGVKSEDHSSRRYLNGINSFFYVKKEEIIENNSTKPTAQTHA